MQTENLETLRSLRIQEKAIKAQIDQVIDAATNEAVACLAEQGLDPCTYSRDELLDNFRRYQPVDPIERMDYDMTHRCEC